MDMHTIHAIFENGVLRPKLPVELTEQAEYEFEPRLVTPPASNGAEAAQLEYSEEGLKKVYEILSERYSSGYSDTAARHNEHQP
jgi:predicted DNA-binding antitoxin AbrB/MazE fold protein